jgi:hypothetical protein
LRYHPAYNARETIAGVVGGVLRHLGTVIVADDGSTDGTAEAARAAGADVIVLGENQGKGAALRLLFAEARRRGFSAVIAVDADGQHDVDDIPSFLRLYRDHPKAIITGSRMGDPDQIPRHRNNAMLVARFFISLAANQFIEDTQCGFRLYPLSVVESISLLKERYVTETEILIKAGDSGGEVRLQPIKAHYPPGHPTHFRNVPDVAAISVYVISYLMVKWGIEGLRPGIVDTYRGPGTGRDVFFAPPRWDRAFEVLTLLTSIHSACCMGCGIISPPVFRSRLYSLTSNGIPVGSMLFSVILLPVLLAFSIVDLIGNRLRINPNLYHGLCAPVLFKSLGQGVDGLHLSGESPLTLPAPGGVGGLAGIARVFIRLGGHCRSGRRMAPCLIPAHDSLQDIPEEIPPQHGRGRHHATVKRADHPGHGKVLSREKQAPDRGLGPEMHPEPLRAGAEAVHLPVGMAGEVPGGQGA